MNPRQLTELAKSLAGRPLFEVDEALRRRHIEPEERIAVKEQVTRLNIAASRQRPRGVRMVAVGEMAHDRNEWHPSQAQQPMSEIERLLTKIGCDLSGRRLYTDAELDDMLKHAGVTSPEHRIACKFEARARGLIRPPRPVDDNSDVEADRSRHRTMKRAIDESYEEEPGATNRRITEKLAENARKLASLRASADTRGGIRVNRKNILVDAVSGKPITLRGSCP